MKQQKKIAWSLWIPVVLAFVLVSIAWTVLTTIAKENPVETIEVSEEP